MALCYVVHALRLILQARELNLQVKVRNSKRGSLNIKVRSRNRILIRIQTSGRLWCQ
jgi:hypothetical protein